MELLEKLEGHNISQYYIIKMWFDSAKKLYVIRYSWSSYVRKYTRTKSLRDYAAASYYFSYSLHMCRRHIGLESSPLESVFHPQSLPSDSMPTPRAAARKSSNVNPSTPAQRNRQRNIILKLNSPKWKY